MWCAIFGVGLQEERRRREERRGFAEEEDVVQRWLVWVPNKDPVPVAVLDALPLGSRRSFRKERSTKNPTLHETYLPPDWSEVEAEEEADSDKNAEGVTGGEKRRRTTGR